MSILIANLKHLYQRRGLWPAYAYFALIIYVAVAVPLDQLAAGLIALQLLIGICIASVVVGTLAKPFAYCLPGHRAVPRKLVFSVGIATSLIGSLLFLAHPGLYAWEWSITILAAFCAALAVYCLGAVLMFLFRGPGTTIILAPLPFVAWMFIVYYVDLELIVVTTPSVAISVGLTTSAVTWIWLGDPNWARRICPKFRAGVFDGWNLDKLHKYTRKKKVEKKDLSRGDPQPWVEQLFLGRMNRCRYTGPSRYIWGELYRSYGLLLPAWKTGPLILVLMLSAGGLLFCYAEHKVPSLLFIVAGVMTMEIRLPIYSSMTIAGGRNERFCTSVILLASATLLIMAVAAIVAAVSVAVAPFMQDFRFRDEYMSFTPMNIRYLIVTAITAPITLTLRLIICGERLERLSAFVPTIVLVVVFLLLITILEKFSILISTLSVAILLILSWLVFVMVLRHVCMKRSLVGQSRTY